MLYWAPRFKPLNASQRAPQCCDTGAGQLHQKCVTLRQACAKLTFDDQGGGSKAQLNKAVGKRPRAGASRTPRPFACSLYRVNGCHHGYGLRLHLVEAAACSS